MRENVKKSEKAGIDAFSEISLDKNTQKQESKIFQKHPCLLRKKLCGCLKTGPQCTVNIWQVDHQKYSAQSGAGSEERAAAAETVLLICSCFFVSVGKVSGGKKFPLLITKCHLWCDRNMEAVARLDVSGRLWQICFFDWIHSRNCFMKLPCDSENDRRKPDVQRN